VRSTSCVIGLDNSIVAVKQKFGFAKNEAVRCHFATDGIVPHKTIRSRPLPRHALHLLTMN
jgi:hypothetical protein